MSTAAMLGRSFTVSFISASRKRPKGKKMDKPEATEKHRSSEIISSMMDGLRREATREELTALKQALDNESPLWTHLLSALLTFADGLTRQAAQLEPDAAAKAHEPPRPEDAEGLRRWLGLDENLQPLPVDLSLVKDRSRPNGR
jgi:hypothetical protein